MMMEPDPVLENLMEQDIGPEILDEESSHGSQDAPETDKKESSKNGSNDWRNLWRSQKSYWGEREGKDEMECVVFESNEDESTARLDEGRRDDTINCSDEERPVGPCDGRDSSLLEPGRQPEAEPQIESEKHFSDQESRNYGSRKGWRLLKRLQQKDNTEIAKANSIDSNQEEKNVQEEAGYVDDIFTIGDLEDEEDEGNVEARNSADTEELVGDATSDGEECPEDANSVTLRKGWGLLNRLQKQHDGESRSEDLANATESSCEEQIVQENAPVSIGARRLLKRLQKRLDVESLEKTDELFELDESNKSEEIVQENASETSTVADGARGILKKLQKKLVEENDADVEVSADTKEATENIAEEETKAENPSVARGLLKRLQKKMNVESGSNIPLQAGDDELAPVEESTDIPAAEESGPESVEDFKDKEEGVAEQISVAEGTRGLLKRLQKKTSVDSNSRAGGNGSEELNENSAAQETDIIEPESTEATNENEEKEEATAEHTRYVADGARGLLKRLQKKMSAESNCPGEGNGQEKVDDSADIHEVSTTDLDSINEQHETMASGDRDTKDEQENSNVNAQDCSGRDSEPQESNTSPKKGWRLLQRFHQNLQAEKNGDEVNKSQTELADMSALEARNRELEFLVFKMRESNEQLAYECKFNELKVKELSEVIHIKDKTSEMEERLLRKSLQSAELLMEVDGLRMELERANECISQLSEDRDEKQRIINGMSNVFKTLHSASTGSNVRKSASSPSEVLSLDFLEDKVNDIMEDRENFVARCKELEQENQLKEDQIDSLIAALETQSQIYVPGATENDKSDDHSVLTQSTSSVSTASYDSFKLRSLYNSVSSKVRERAEALTQSDDQSSLKAEAPPSTFEPSSAVSKPHDFANESLESIKEKLKESDPQYFEFLSLMQDPEIVEESSSSDSMHDPSGYETPPEERHQSIDLIM